MSTIVSVENVSREFRKYYQKTFKEFLTDRHAKNFNKVFWALKDVSFEEIESKPSDPKLIILDSTLASHEFAMSFSHEFDISIKATVDNFIENTPEIRLHH